MARKVQISPIIWWTSYLLVSRCWMPMRYRIRYHCPSGRMTAPALVASKHVGFTDIPLLADLVRRHAKKCPYFEMATFVGYGVLEKIIPILYGCGGLEVMRPKDVRRISQKTGRPKREVLEEMKQVNLHAMEARKAILSRGDVLCYFPEGERDKQKVGKLISSYEVEEVIEAAKTGTAVPVVPVTLNYRKLPRGSIPWIRRGEVDVITHEPIDVTGKTADEVLAELKSRYDETFEPTPVTPRPDAGP